eukprot:6183837-Pleurochrysis_carterae.AAC.5
MSYQIEGGGRREGAESGEWERASDEKLCWRRRTKYLTRGSIASVRWYEDGHVKSVLHALTLSYATHMVKGECVPNCRASSSHETELSWLRSRAAARMQALIISKLSPHRSANATSSWAELWWQRARHFQDGAETVLGTL